MMSVTVTGRQALRFGMLAGLGALTIEVRWIWRYYQNSRSS